jgi:anti-sigma factor RsiW
VTEAPDEHLGDDVVELVLGTVDGDRRARMAAHVLRCSACRHEYDELAATVSTLVPAAPAVQPSLGFEERAMARFGVAEAGAPRRTARRWWAWAAVAAAAVVALFVPFAIWNSSDDGNAGQVATLHLSRDGTAVGTVSVSELDGRAMIVVALVGAPEDVSYYCRVRFADGSTIESESWPAGNGAWVIPLADAHGVTAVDVLPQGTEKVWSAATFT